MHTDLPKNARATYETANRDMAHWLVQRKDPASPWIDTKLNAITLEDFTDEDGLKGPSYRYGWIQGRGLEALVTHAAYFEPRDPDLAASLNDWAKALYAALDRLWEQNGSASFCYDADFAPVCTGGNIPGAPQIRQPGFSTYADTFVTKGLIAAAARFAPDESPRHLDKLANIIAAIEENRFVISEAGDVDETALAAQPDDFGPRMILLTAASLTRRLGLAGAGDFAPRFIAHVLSRHLDPATGLIAVTSGGDTCNIGHAIEFTGFAFEALGAAMTDELARQLHDILATTFSAGFHPPGLCLTVDMATSTPTSPYCPWWSLPETIRAAALVYERTGSADMVEIWSRAHQAFFTRYWRTRPPVAYQCLTAGGPADVVLGTPDLDAGYHTGLSLLTAIEALDRMKASPLR